ncbi:MAG: lysophospholipid acyltransferase family protein [Polyangiaceae bacterium]
MKRRAAVALTKATRVLGRDVLPRARRGAVGAMDEAALMVLGDDFEDRVSRVPVHVGEGRVDPFGFDLHTAKRFVAACAFFHRVYFRSEVRGIHHIPEGRVLIISNHSGQLPIDGMLIGTSMFFDADPPRFVRSMVEKWTQTLPFVGTLFQRVGQVVGVPENARRLLAQGEAVLVFPEGARGVSKPFVNRYQLEAFGLGFMRLALETNTPIVPVAVIGGEEQYINLGNSERLARLMRMPTFPIVPQWLLPGGQLPLPTKYRIEFGPALHFDGDADDEDAVVGEHVEKVRATIQAMLDRGLKRRSSVFW